MLGAYYLTRERQFAQGEGMKFASIDELRAAYDAGVVDLQAAVEARIEGKLQKTTVGRALFFEIVPDEHAVRARQPRHGHARRSATS